jgi:hypothetical protein
LVAIYLFVVKAIGECEATSVEFSQTGRMHLGIRDVAVLFVAARARTPLEPSRAKRLMENSSRAEAEGAHKPAKILHGPCSFPNRTYVLRVRARSLTCADGTECQLQKINWTWEDAFFSQGENVCFASE